MLVRCTVGEKTIYRELGPGAEEDEALRALVHGRGRLGVDLETWPLTRRAGRPLSHGRSDLRERKEGLFEVGRRLVPAIARASSRAGSNSVSAGARNTRWRGTPSVPRW